MMLMKQIDADVRKIAACGLYCGACRKHLAGKCNGCRLNERAKWCKIRTCCMANGFDTCAECGHDVSDCRLQIGLDGCSPFCQIPTALLASVILKNMVTGLLPKRWQNVNAKL